MKAHSAHRVLMICASAALLPLLGACSAQQPVSIAEESYAGRIPSDAITTPVPTPTEPSPLGEEPWVGWLSDGDQFAIALAGSSSCPRLPTAVTVDDAHSIIISLADSGGSVCTADLAPRTHIIETPSGLDLSRDVAVKFDGNDNVLGLLPPLER